MTVSPLLNIIYPESDGQPVADNTIQFRYITMIHGGLDSWFKDNPNVFVAADLFWYPVEGEPWTRQAPDVMVIFGRSKGDRRSYKQWEEENIPPQVVFEIASKSNTIEELESSKLQFYQRYGVEEYYLYDPERGKLKGWLLTTRVISPIILMDGWESPRLQIKFTLVGKELQLYLPNGDRFLNFVELFEQRQFAELAKQEAELAKQEAELAKQEAELAKQEAEKQRDEEAKARRDAIPKLRNMGLNDQQIAEILSLSLDELNSV
jgi:Uma2 family endonuclease